MLCNIFTFVQFEFCYIKFCAILNYFLLLGEYWFDIIFRKW